LHDLPQNYSQRIRLYDAEGNVSAQKHLDWFNDFIDLEEVDYTDEKMWLFTQILSGDVRKWFKSLPPTSIQDFAAFETSFLDKWGDKKNPLQLLTQYNNMKKAPEEMVQEFSAHFLKVYNSIPAEVKPPPGVAQLRYTDSFKNDFSLLLRERRSANLDAIMSNVVEVEVNMMASGKIKPRFNRGDKRPQGDAQLSTSRSSDDKFNMMMKTMENLMERMSMGNRPVAREQNDPPPRNPNLWRGQIPQIRQREQKEKRDQGDQQTRPPFQNNYVDEDFDQTFDDQIHCCDDQNPRVFLTKSEHDQYMSRNEGFVPEADDDMILKTDDASSWETEEFRKGYQNAIMQFQKKYNLRSKDVPVESQQTNPIRKPSADTPSTS
jgi:hypothetical protein